VTTARAYRKLRRRLAAAIRENQWTLPAFGAIAGIVLGLLLFNIDETPGDNWTITVSQARATLTSLVALMFTILSLSLSMTTVALDNVSSHFSMRMLTVSVHDYRTKIATSVFALAVSYIGVELFKLTGLAGDALTPRLPFAVAVLLIVASAAALFWQLNYTIQSLRLDRSLARLERVIRRAADSAERGSSGWRRGSLPVMTEESAPVFAEGSGYVTDVDLDGVVDLATEREVTVVIDRGVGEAVVTGETLGWIDAGPGSPPSSVFDEVRSVVQVEAGRDVSHDVGFGVRILVDIASLALSPAVNDPQTAVEVVNELTIVLADLAGRDLGPRSMTVHGDTVGWVAAPTLGDLLVLATEQISRYGSTEPSVVKALVRLCNTVERVATSEVERDAARVERDSLMIDTIREGTGR
jgi:uncharacterized membrane protein